MGIKRFRVLIEADEFARELDHGNIECSWDPDSKRFTIKNRYGVQKVRLNSEHVGVDISVRDSAKPRAIPLTLPADPLFHVPWTFGFNSGMRRKAPSEISNRAGARIVDRDFIFICLRNPDGQLVASECWVGDQADPEEMRVKLKDLIDPLC